MNPAPGPVPGSNVGSSAAAVARSRQAALDAAGLLAGIDTLATSTRLTTESVADTQRAAEDLARMSGEVQTMVGRFRV